MRDRQKVLTCVLGAFVLVAPLVAAAQPPGPPPPPPPPIPQTGPLTLPGPVRVFIDCSGYWYCDSEYFRTNITFVDHVRDRNVADVHVLITGQGTGSGGSEATLTFFGRGPFNGVSDVLTYTSLPNAASDTVRAGLVKSLKLGLTRYVSHSPAGSNLQVSLAPASQQTPAAPTHDPWNYWVMRVSLNCIVGGESSSTRESYSGSTSARRTTNAWKINLAANLSYRESSYDFGDGETFSSISRSSGASVLVVKSLGSHWSLGGRASLESSTYNNQDRALRVAPAIEYDFFPYAESTRRLLTARYTLGITSLAYRETTLYEKDDETLGLHSLELGLSARQPWGQMNASVDVSQYVSRPDKYRVESWGSVNLKIGKGLAFNVAGGASWIRDQISLPKGEASRDEVLVRQRQLATSYDYSVYFGISYTFGSIYNNIVNPRFDSGMYY
jgi:hypothetical protein